MPKTIAVTGATGVQGGSVARKMLAEGWNVRALTRNPSSAAAQALAEQGAKVVDADIDKPETLDEAFEVLSPPSPRPKEMGDKGKAIKEKDLMTDDA